MPFYDHQKSLAHRAAGSPCSRRPPLLLKPARQRRSNKSSILRQNGLAWRTKKGPGIAPGARFCGNAAAQAVASASTVCFDAGRPVSVSPPLMALRSVRSLRSGRSPEIPPTLILRGFIASGISRTRSIASRPSLGPRRAPRRGRRAETPLERAVGDAAKPMTRNRACRPPHDCGRHHHTFCSAVMSISSREPGDRELDPVVIVADLDQVERRVILAAAAHAAVLQHVEQPVETDRGAPVA